MISQLTGTLISKAPDGCVIDVGGVGYGVVVSLGTFAALPDAGARMTLVIHTHVREDQLLLYGFSTPEERTIFQRLIGVSGVGPKTALAILSGLPAHHLVDAIAAEDKARLSTIPGVGKKTAERIIIELKDRLARDVALSPGAAPAGPARLREDAVSALTNLGYGRPIAEEALRKIKWTDGMPLEDAIRAALKELCRIP